MAPKSRIPIRKTIDFGRVADSADLPSMLLAEGIAVRNGKAFCPFHANDQTEALSIYHKSGRWQFKCHSCGVGGDAIDWRAMRDGITKLDAVRLLDRETIGTSTTLRVHAEPAPKRPQPPHESTNPEWQRTVSEMIELAHDELWCGNARCNRALEWLRYRGLEDFTIRQHRLGYFGAEGWSPKYRKLDGDMKSIYHAGGIVIPWASPNGYYGKATHAGVEEDRPRWIGVNVRKLMPDPFHPLPEFEEKNECFAGSHRGFGYPFGEILASQGGRPCLVCEGEIDSLIATQEVGDLVNVMTVGGAKQKPDRTALVALSRCPWILLALDADQAGFEGVRMWLDIVGSKGKRVLLRGYKDIGDMHQAGLSVREWLIDEMDRLEVGATTRQIGWRERVAGWPTYAWKLWHDRSIKLTPPGADADQIREAQKSAYDQLAKEAGVSARS